MCLVKQSFKRLHYPVDVILVCLRWYLAYSLSLRNLEEMMQERGIDVDHSTIHRWVLRLTPKLARVARKKRKIYGGTWYLDETYIRIKGKWHYLYRAVEASGETIDFILSQKRNKKSALRFLKKAIHQNTYPMEVNIDKSGANRAALMSLNQRELGIKIRQCRYKNNMVEQDHRFIKKRYRAMLGFKTYRTAKVLLEGIEILHMLHKQQIPINGLILCPVDAFYTLVA